MLLRYVSAVALAPLAMASTAQAQAVISGTRTTSIATSTANEGTPADIRISEDGAVEVTSGTAVAGDSSHSIDLDEGSAITMDDAADGATGIRLDAGFDGDLVIGGAISITDSLDEYEDADEDGDVDGPFALGTGRYGARAAGSGVRNGGILVENTGSIAVEGEDSYGLAIESQLEGSLTVLGAVSVVGDRSTGISLQGDVAGDVLLSGSAVSAAGAGAVAVSVEGDIGGTLQVQSTLSATGYRYTSVPTSLADLEEEDREDIDLADDSLYYEDLDADDLLQGGPALQVSGSVAGGILLGTGPAYEDSDGEDGDDDLDGVINGDEDWDGDGIINADDEDIDGDGILDDDEGTASIASYGGAPALEIGAVDGDITIGMVGSGEDAFGLVNEGTVSASGLYDDVAATALRIGGEASWTTLIEGGLRNDGSIGASSSEANATALLISAGATLPAVVNSGSITASATTEGADSAFAIQVEDDANLQALANHGTIMAVIYGETGTATAISDRSGTLTSLTNSGGIYALVSATDSLTDTDDDNDDADDEVVTGREIAIDLSTTTAGVALLQYGELTDTSKLDSDGDDIMDDADTDDDDDGILDGADDEDSDSDNDGVYDSDEPYIYGEIHLGSGADVIDLQNGVIVGDVSFGAGADRFSINGGAQYQGVLSDSDGLLDISVEDGVLDARQSESLAISSLTVGADGELVISIDPVSDAAGGFTVSGMAKFAAGAGIDLNLTSLVGAEGERFTLVSAGSLVTASPLDTDLTADVPYLIVADITADLDANAVYADVRRRTTEEMALSGVESAAYDAFYTALSLDEDVMEAFLAPAEREDFMNLYEQTLPDHSGGTLTSLASGIDAVTRALAERNNTTSPGEVSGWVQEINFYEDKGRTDTYGYRAEGFGLAGGVEKMTQAGAIGVSVAISSSELADPEAEAEENLAATVLEIGTYWRRQQGAWTTWARGGVGYATFESERTLVGDGIYLANEADWNGYTLSAAGGVAYERNFGRLSIRPQAYAEYFSLSESSRRETGGGDAFDLEVDGRHGSLASGTALVKIGYAMDSDLDIRPELTLGWKHVFHADYDETTARYISGGPAFTLTGEPLTGGGPLLGFGLTVSNAVSRFTVAADAQLRDDYARYSFMLQAAFLF